MTDSVRPKGTLVFGSRLTAVHARTEVEPISDLEWQQTLAFLPIKAEEYAREAQIEEYAREARIREIASQ